MNTSSVGASPARGRLRVGAALVLLASAVIGVASAISGCSGAPKARVAAATQPAAVASEKLVGWIERRAAVPAGSQDPRETVAFSPDGRRLAYVARDTGPTLWVNNEKTAVHGGFGLPLVFSPDGQHLAYRAYDDPRSDKSRVVIDGQPGPTYDATRGGQFSPDGSRFAYAARRDGKSLWVINGKEQTPHDELIGNVAFSADGKRVRYLARDGKRSFLVEDGKPHEPFDYVLPPLAVSADGERFGYVAGFGEAPRERPAGRMVSPWKDSKVRPFAVVDGRAEAPHGHVHSVTISPDGSRVAYVTVEPGDRSRVLVNGETHPVHRWVNEGSLVFSDDGTRLAYVAIDRGEPVVVVDDSTFAVDAVTMPPRFSAGGEHVAFAGRRGSSQFVFVDGRPGPALDADRPARFAFTPDGAHVVYCGVPQAGWEPGPQPYALLLDDAVLGRCGYVVGPIVFDDRGRFWYIETRRHDDDSESFYLVDRVLPGAVGAARAPTTTPATAPAGGSPSE